MLKKIGKLLIFSVITSIFLLQFSTFLTPTATDFTPISGDNMCIGLNYHRVRKPTFWNKLFTQTSSNDSLSTYSVYTDEFEQQLDALIAANAYFATPTEIESFQQSGIFPDMCVWISFDDVDQSVYQNAFPLLKERNIPFTLFVITGQVGNPDFNNLQMSSWDELREMQASGLASFGSHTHNLHYLLDGKAVFLHPEYWNRLKTDLEESLAVFQQELGINVTTLAYPFGETTEQVTELVRSLGFTTAAILSPNPITAVADSHYQNRYIASSESFKHVIFPWLNQNK